ncbi:MAG: hypothetical protein ACI89X_001676 [Planctomycetota bacterium]|jgi:hypothetical protein
MGNDWLHTARVRFGIGFLLVALGLLVGAWSAFTRGASASLVGGIAIALMLWTAVACCVVSAAWILPVDRGSQYRRVHWLYGKRSDGTRVWWAALLTLPFLGPVSVWWHLRRPALTEAPWHELLPDLLIGRRLLDREFDLQVEHIVDLTCEYAERPHQRCHKGYVSLPIVDGAAPPPQVLRQYAERLSKLQGRIYLHCAEGHGRTATVAAALLIVRGVASDVDDALARIAAVRPKARPYARQMRALRRIREQDGIK